MKPYCKQLGALAFVLLGVGVASAAPAWQQVRSFEAHPRKAKSSGTMSEGSVLALAFLDPTGWRLAVGGSDDRVRVIRASDGKTMWRSKRLGKNVERLAACDGGSFASQTYSGRMDVWRPRSKGWKYRSGPRIKHQMGWFFGFESGCKNLAASGMSDAFSVYSAADGRVIGKIPSVARGLDRRGLAVRGHLLSVEVEGGIEIYDLSGAKPKRIGPAFAVEKVRDGARLVQAQPLAPGRLLLEYCNVARCEVVITGGGPVLSFAIKGSVWAAEIGSTLVLSPDERWLFFFRRGLAPQIVEVAKDARQTIEGRVDWKLAAFSGNSKVLAIGHHPKGYMVTLFKLPHYDF